VDLQITLAHGTPREVETSQCLLGLTYRHNLSPYTFTRLIRIEQGVVPHSHPVLTLNTLYRHAPELLRATYLHEQILESDHSGSRKRLDKCYEVRIPVAAHRISRRRRK
jgi:hypothetical protein